MSLDRFLIVAIAVIAAAAGPTPTPSPTPSGPTSFSGRWRFNKDQSEDAREKMREAMQGRERGGGGSWGGGRGGGGFGGHGGGFGGRGGGFGGRGGGAGEPGGSPEGQESLRGLFEAPAELTVTQTETEIAILDDDGLLRTLHPDNREYKAEAGASEVKTRWDGERLIVETTRDRGPKTTETFSLIPDRRQMVVDLRIEGRRSGPVTVRRVYDAQPAE